MPSQNLASLVILVWTSLPPYFFQWERRLGLKIQARQLFPMDQVLMDYESSEMNQIVGNMIVIGVSFVVIAAVVIVVVANVDIPTEAQDNPVTTAGFHLSVDTVCGKTDHRGLCQATLGPVGNNSDPVKYFTATINATLVAMRNVVGNELRGDVQKGALGDCIGLIDLGIDQLELVLAVRSEDVLGRKSVDVKNSLNAVISYGTNKNAFNSIILQNPDQFSIKLCRSPLTLQEMHGV